MIKILGGWMMRYELVVERGKSEERGSIVNGYGGGGRFEEEERVMRNR
jgi:hypothetical protein